MSEVATSRDGLSGVAMTASSERSPFVGLEGHELSQSMNEDGSNVTH